MNATLCIFILNIQVVSGKKLKKKSELSYEEYLVKFVGGPTTEIIAACADVWWGREVTSRPTPDPSNPLPGVELQAPGTLHSFTQCTNSEPLDFPPTTNTPTIKAPSDDIISLSKQFIHHHAHTHGRVDQAWRQRSESTATSPARRPRPHISLFIMAALELGSKSEFTSSARNQFFTKVRQFP